MPAQFDARTSKVSNAAIHQASRTISYNKAAKPSCLAEAEYNIASVKDAQSQLRQTWNDRSLSSYEQKVVRQKLSRVYDDMNGIIDQMENEKTRMKNPFSNTRTTAEELQIQAAPEIDLAALESSSASTPARIVPASPSYFTASPVFNDNLLLLRALHQKYESLPTVSSENAPRTIWMTLSQYRSSAGEAVAASKYSKVLALLTRLNKIHPRLRPSDVTAVIERFRRPGTAAAQKAKPGQIDEFGRAKGVGRRKESSARVYLVEGTGEIILNGRSIVQTFPRLHDRESAMWPLKISERMDKYNVFVLVEGGGITGQAEAVTLALARALLVHEPALKPVLRRAGCVTSDARRVERKKPGRLKARKRPTWVKR